MTDDLRSSLQEHLGDRYRLRDEAGRGGMARVYRAEDRNRGGEVAIKVLRPELAAALGHERFLREIRILGRLHHPNILPLLDSGEGGGSLYYIAPYVPGASLQRRLERDGPLRIAEVIRIARATRSERASHSGEPGAASGRQRMQARKPAPWAAAAPGKKRTFVRRGVRAGQEGRQ